MDINLIFNIIAITGIAAITVGYLYSQFNKGKSQQGKANLETTAIYEDLNKALKEQVSTLEDKMDKAITEIKTLRSDMRTMANDISNYEDLIVRSLKEYYVEHPQEAQVQSTRTKRK